MEFRASCSICGKKHVADLPEGEMMAWFKCECGTLFGHALFIEPCGKVFLYGVEALRKERYSSACIQFATAFEVFQKQYVEILLKKQGVEKSLARFIIYDLELPREKYSQIARHIMHNKLKHPDVSIRNRAVHFGQIPERARVIELGKNVLEAVNIWIKEAERIVGLDYKRLWDARDSGQLIPEDATEFDRAIFELRIAYRLMLGGIIELEDNE